MAENSIDLNCKICGKKFVRSVSLNRHTAICKIRLSYDTNKESPESVFFNEPSSNVDITEIPEMKLDEITDESSLQCNHISQAYREQSDLAYHFIEECHESSVVLHQYNSRDKEFVEKRKLDEHSKSCPKRPRELFKCAECLKAFLHETSLIKHQSRVHKTQTSKLNYAQEKSMLRDVSRKKSKMGCNAKRENEISSPFECSTCKKVFIDRRNLIRHDNTIHQSGANAFQCSKCEKTFNRGDNFKRHLETCSTRLVSDGFICYHCGREFKKKSVLKWHLFRRHSDFGASKCEICGVKFKGISCEFALRRHIKESHKDNNFSGSLKCSLCVKAFSSRDNILSHLIEEHDIAIHHDHLEFPSVNQFNEWKVNMEKATMTFFRNRRGFTQSKNHSISIYECHRSGYYQPKTNNRKRRMKLQGTKKIGSYCPAEISLCIKKSNGFCSVSFINVHLGHDIHDENELAHLSLPKIERAEIASKISEGVSRDEILKNYSQSEYDQDNLLSKKDLNNICRAFNVKERPRVVSDQPGSEFVDLESFAKRHKKSILLLKQFGEMNDRVEDILSAKDFLMVIMTENQKKILRKYGSKVISIDGTFAMNDYNFLLLTLLIIDSYHDGVPVAFAISSRKSFVLVDVFLTCIRKEMNSLGTEIFMSDLECNYYDQWEDIMGPAQNRPFCKWYLPEAWHQKLKMITDAKKRELTKNWLHDITNQLDEALFYLQINDFFANDDPDLREFLKELKDNHFTEIENWTACLRENTEANTYSYVESFNRTLKYLYGKLTKANTLNSLLSFIDNHLVSSEREMRRKEIRGVLSHKLSDLRRRHDECTKDHVIINIENVFDGEWYVSVTDEDSDVADVHFIRERNDICSGCKLYCEKCNTCAQKYQCTCADNALRNNMCKHIHALGMHLNRETSGETEHSVDNSFHLQYSADFPDSPDSKKADGTVFYCDFSTFDSKELAEILNSSHSGPDNPRSLEKVIQAASILHVNSESSIPEKLVDMSCDNSQPAEG